MGRSSADWKRGELATTIRLLATCQRPDSTRSNSVVPHRPAGNSAELGRIDSRIGPLFENLILTSTPSAQWIRDFMSPGWLVRDSKRCRHNHGSFYLPTPKLSRTLRTVSSLGWPHKQDAAISVYRCSRHSGHRPQHKQYGASHFGQWVSGGYLPRRFPHAGQRPHPGQTTRPASKMASQPPH